MTTPSATEQGIISIAEEDVTQQRRDESTAALVAIRDAAYAAYVAQSALNDLISATVSGGSASRNTVARAAGMTRRGVDYAILDAGLVEVSFDELRVGDEVRYTRADAHTAPLMRRTWLVARAYGPAIGQPGTGVLLHAAGNRNDPWLIEGRDFDSDTRFLVARSL